MEKLRRQARIAFVGLAAVFVLAYVVSAWVILLLALVVGGVAFGDKIAAAFRAKDEPPPPGPVL